MFPLYFIFNMSFITLSISSYVLGLSFLTLTAVYLFWYLYKNNKTDVILQADD